MSPSPSGALEGRVGWENSRGTALSGGSNFIPKRLTELGRDCCSEEVMTLPLMRKFCCFLFFSAGNRMGESRT